MLSLSDLTFLVPGRYQLPRSNLWGGSKHFYGRAA